jgi:hypothetical protein
MTFRPLRIAEPRSAAGDITFHPIRTLDSSFSTSREVPVIGKLQGAAMSNAWAVSSLPTRTRRTVPVRDRIPKIGICGSAYA